MKKQHIYKSLYRTLLKSALLNVVDMDNVFADKIEPDDE